MNHQEFITQTEIRYGIVLPELYKRLAVDNMLNWGEFSPDWYHEVFPTLLQHPPLLLIGSEFELPVPDTLWEVNETLNNAGDWIRLKPEYRSKMITFAEVGNGDYYAFDYTQAGEPCIVRLYHDSRESLVEAGNLSDFIFRRLLQVQEDYYDGDGMTPETYREHLFAQLASHKPYISTEQYDFLRETYQKPFQKDRWGGLFMLTDDETEAARQRFIAFERLDAAFEPFEYD